MLQHDEMSWPIGPDLADEFDFFFLDEEEELPEWQPHWDPGQFAQNKGMLKLDDWRLSEEELQALTMQAVEFRTTIDTRAKLYENIDEIPRCAESSSLPSAHVSVHDNQASQTKSSRTLSTRASNPEGLLEKELLARERHRAPPGRKYKKRRRSELSIVEMEEIVDGYLTKGMYQADVAKFHRVTPALVSNLVTEAQRRPEKLREMKEQKKQR